MPFLAGDLAGQIHRVVAGFQEYRLEFEAQPVKLMRAGRGKRGKMEKLFRIE
jgi:hypothetical protein